MRRFMDIDVDCVESCAAILATFWSDSITEVYVYRAFAGCEKRVDDDGEVEVKGLYAKYMAMGECYCVKICMCTIGPLDGRF